MKEDEPLREPVVTGAIRLEIHGDRERGIAFSHRARAQLGLMLNYHGVPERIAAGEPGGFFHSSHTYAGGVRIQTLTNNGQHTARIFVPPLPKPPLPKEKPPREREVEYPEFMICGTCVVGEEDQAPHAVRWTSPTAVEDLGLLPGGVEAEALDISEDGETVVGSCQIVVDDFAYTHAFRWTKASGMVDLGVFKPIGSMVATGVNADGTIIVGSGSGVSVSEVGWVWTEATGCVELPHEGLGVPAIAKLKVSPDGGHICGTVSTPLVDGANFDGAVWSKDIHGAWQITLIPKPGTVSRWTYSGTPPADLDFSDTNFPTNITDAGVVTGYTTHQEVDPWWVTQTFWDRGDGVPVPFVSGVEGDRGESMQVLLPARADVFTFDVTSGTYALLGITGANAVGAADDEGTIVGNDLTGTKGDIVDFSEGTGPPAPLSRVIYYGLTLEFFNNGWYWQEQQGKVSLGANTQTYDVAEDGSLIVGSTGVGEARTPIAWPGDGPDIDLPMLEGSVYGFATACTSQIKQTYTEPE